MSILILDTTKERKICLSKAQSKGLKYNLFKIFIIELIIDERIRQ